MDENFFFGIKEVKLNDLTIQASLSTDIYLKLEGKKLIVQLLGDKATSIKVYQGQVNKNKGITKVLESGEYFHFKLD